MSLAVGPAQALFKNDQRFCAATSLNLGMDLSYFYVDNDNRYYYF